jgi:hypothetical protein
MKDPVSREAQEVEGAVIRATHRRYRINYDALDQESLREFIRMLRDLEYEKTSAVKNARLQPWRR